MLSTQCSWVFLGVPWDHFPLLLFFCKKVQRSLQRPLFSTTMLGPYSSLPFQPKKPPRIPMQGEFMWHHLLCNQLDSVPVWLSLVQAGHFRSQDSF